jgi:uncharacterized protein with HEPN domain
MGSPTLTERLEHMFEAIGHIETNTAGMDLDQFRQDRFRQFGVERCLEIISEASRHIPDDVKALHPEIPWRQVADIGNRVRHAYHAVDSEIVWAIVTGELRELKAALSAIRDEEDGSSA